MAQVNRPTKYDVKQVTSLVASRKPTSAYLGWVGQGNLGDESILLGQKLIHDEEIFVLLPNHHMRRILDTVDRLRPSRIPDRVLLGGGTVIGRQEWLTRLNAYLAVRRGGEVRVWGAGVEDPSFLGTRTHATSESLTAWKDVLAKVSAVGVRGPRSAELLGDIGIEAVVVGDPALAITPTVAGGSTDKRSIALNIATPEDSYGSDPRPSTWAMDLTRTLVAKGYRVFPFAMEKSDLAPTQQVADSSPACRGVVYEPSDALELVNWLADKGAVISQRLHGSILSAAAGTPFISLDYRPKCADFAASVSMSDFNVRIDRTSIGEIVELTSRLESEGDRIRQDLAREVNGLRTIQRT